MYDIRPYWKPVSIYLEDIRHNLCLMCWILNNSLICQYLANFMSYQEISDRFWERVSPLLEPYKRRKPRGSKPLDFRAVLNGIFYFLKTGCQWEFLPTCYGSKSAVHDGPAAAFSARCSVMVKF